MVNIEIDGEKLEVPQGKMIIEVADEVGIPIPRFCYHKKLSIAANCRMCLVEVGNAPKPLPACATPVSEGMKIFTVSERAKEAQKAVMEFLLINHPLDCPVCDQGGQCELQDVALEYGQDYSRYTEPKRVVKDKNLGPLISTEMTRCIHCTRCVRFGTEVAGVREMGATGRGEHTQIGTYVENTVNSELSGNVIDLCPVGALTSKPFRFLARAWELKSHPSVSAHDCLGSNLFFHTYKNKVIRTLPRDNESINEVWLSDRDRFSYEGLNHPDRLMQPCIKRDGKWEITDWATALNVAVEKLQGLFHEHGPNQLGVLASPNATVEEFYLTQKLFRDQGCANIDHRLKDMDTAHQNYQGLAPKLGITLSELQNQEAIYIIGSDIRKEQPIVAHRIRKAALHGAQVSAVNPCGIDFNFPVKQQVIGTKGDIIQPLMEILKAAQMQVNQTVGLKGLEEQFAKITPSEAAQTFVSGMQGKKSSVILGAYALSHPQSSLIYALSYAIAQALGASFGEMSAGANGAGGWLAGAVPHRLPMGKTAAQTGLSAQEMLKQSLKGYLLLNCEPEFDCADPLEALSALDKAQSVVVMTAFDNAYMREYADVLLPITPISEMKGTYVNAFGDWQAFEPAAMPLGESRPAWKVLRVLGNLMKIPGFEFESVDAVLNELKNQQQADLEIQIQTMDIVPTNITYPKVGQLVRLAPTPLYAVDGITRRASALQQTEDANVAVVKMSIEQSRKLALKEDQLVWVSQGGVRAKAAMPVVISELIPTGTAWVAHGIEQTQTLGAPYGLIELTPAG